MTSATRHDLLLNREHGVQAPLPFVLVHDFEGYDFITLGRDEFRPILPGGVFRADVEYAPFIDRVRRFLEVNTLGLDDEDPMKLIVGIRLVRPQRKDEVRVYLAAPPSLDVVVLPCPVAVPDE